MKASMWLRIASVLTFVHAVLHTVGGVFGKPDAGAATVAVEAMKANEFMLMGNVRTYFEFFRGMGLAVSIFLTFEAFAFWIMAGLAKRDAKRLRPLLAVFLLAYLAMAWNSYEYFFLAPVITEVLIAGCLGFAWIVAGQAAEPGQQGLPEAAR